MTDDERPRRPILDRREPMRQWANMFGGAEPPRNGPLPADGATADPAAAGDPQRRASLGDAISRSVDLGYRVIDEYIRQGQRAAQRMSDRSFSADGAVGDLREASDRMGQYASDFFGLWMEFMELTTNRSRDTAANGTAAAVPRADVPGAAAATQPAPAAATAAGPPAPRPPHAGVRVEVRSLRPTEVAVDLQPDAAGRALRVYGFGTAGADRARGIDVAIRAGSDHEPVGLSVRVSSEQSPGTYRGLVVDDATSAPVGTLTVQVGEDE
jgi:hypothetical protein